jgi:hypothetical protein
MLKNDNTIIGLQNFANQIVIKAKENLQKKDKVVSGTLYDSIKSTGVKISKNSLEIGISMASYGGYIDKGVSGTEVKYDTPYSYKNLKPPTSALDSWIVQRGIAPRNSKGQFLDRKSVQFAISRAIFKNGIKPSNFLKEAVQETIPLLPIEIKDKFGLDVKSSLDFIIKTNKKK